MSIIYEALKKIENKNNALPVDSQITMAVTASKNEYKKRNFSPFLFAAVFIISIIFLIVVGTYFLNSAKQNQRESYSITPKEVTLEKKVEPETIKEEKPPEVKSVDILPVPTYVLQGVIYDKDSPSAIINGKTLKKSDRIDSFEIIEITPTTVKLLNLNDGTELGLSF